VRDQNIEKEKCDDFSWMAKPSNKEITRIRDCPSAAALGRQAGRHLIMLVW
jgi:hypothetical protein